MCLIQLRHCIYLIILLGIPLYICNDETYGYITIPLEKDSSLEMDISQLTNIKLEITGNNNFNVV